jgi:hypothetical protein
MATTYPIPTTAELDGMCASLSNWTKWGKDDQRGALNFLTDEHRVAAVRLVATAGEPATGASPHAGFWRRARL